MRKLLLSMLVLISVGQIGCSKKSAPSIAAQTGNPVTPPVNPGVSADAAEVAFQPVSISELSEFAKWPLNNPTNIKLKVDLFEMSNPDGSARYGGGIQISYNDGGAVANIRLTTGGSRDDVIHNRWFFWEGRPVFHAFFEDDKPIWADVAGGVILVIDESSDLGDGATTPLVSGSVWYMNFQPSQSGGVPPQADRRCWHVSLGPYDCRAFLVGDQIQTTSRLYPEWRTLSTGVATGYKKLGTFTNLNLNEAFNL